MEVYEIMENLVELWTYQHKFVFKHEITEM